MPKMNLRTTVRATEQDVYLELAMDGEPLGHMFLDATDIDALISQLSNCRMQLSDEVPKELDPGARLDAIYDPAWRIEAFNQDPAHAVLLLRHPGLGWISFVMPPPEVRSMGEWLVAHHGGQSSGSAVPAA